MGFWRLLTGPEDIGRGPLFWLGVRRCWSAFLAWYPRTHQRVRGLRTSPTISSTSRWRSGLCLLWGYCGVLSFGQVAYFGIAGYVYGIIAGNLMGNPLGAADRLAWAGLAACAVVAAVFGYFVFYARVQMWIAPILTLVFTLLLETFLGQTAGYQWRVGTVQLGGYNGMTGIPSFQLGELVFFGYPFYYYVLLARRALLSSAAACW